MMITYIKNNGFALVTFVFLLTGLLLQPVFPQTYTVRVYGTVTDEESNAVSEALVSFISRDGETDSTRTDTIGAYSVQLVLTDVGVKEDQPPSPQKYKLFQNYPNPFNPGTVIKFELLRPEHVKLTVFNLNGQVVRILVDGFYPAGLSRVRWDGTNTTGRRVTAGIYFYRIEAGRFNKTRKMLLLDGGGVSIRSVGTHSLKSLFKPKVPVQKTYTIWVKKPMFHHFVKYNFDVTVTDTVINKDLVLTAISPACTEYGPPVFEGPHDELTPPIQVDQSPSWSPDGNWIAYKHFDDTKPPSTAHQLWLINPETLERRFVRYGGLQTAWFPSSDSLILAKDGQLYIMRLDGEIRRQLTETGLNHFPDISHDGKWLVWDVDYWDIWLMNLETGESWPIPKDTTQNWGAWRAPSWSPDDSLIAHDRGTIYIMTRDGTFVEQITYENVEYLNPRWSPDSIRIAFVSRECEWSRDVFVYDLETDRYERITFEGAEYGISWSPEGNYIVYSKYNGDWENYHPLNNEASRTGFLYIVNIHTKEEYQITFDEDYE